MAQKRFNTKTEFSFSDMTESVNIIPESGVTFNVSYWTGSAWTPDDLNPRSTPSQVAVQATRVQVDPTGGYVAVVGKGDF